MNKIGMYYSYWIDNWEATYSSFVPMVADLGFDIFEINSSRLFAAGSRTSPGRLSQRVGAADRRRHGEHEFYHPADQAG